MFYTNILEIIRMYLVQIAENSPLLVFMPSSALSVYVALLLLIIGISLFLSYRVDSIQLLTVMKLYFLFFSSTILFSFFSRPQVNQDAYLMFFDYWILTIFFHYIYKHRHSFFIFRGRAEIWNQEGLIFHALLSRLLLCFLLIFSIFIFYPLYPVTMS